MANRLKFKQAVFADGKFVKFHYWGFIKNKFIPPIGLPKYNSQPLGIKDKNGVDIYDCDILKIDNVGAMVHFEYNQKFCCYDWVVSSDSKKKNAALAHSITEAMERYKKPFNKMAEIVGNIFENPEIANNG